MTATTVVIDGGIMQAASVFGERRHSDRRAAPIVILESGDHHGWSDRRTTH
jgi:hypothetical protein